MAKAIQERASTWEVRALDWTAISQRLDPDEVRIRGGIAGEEYGAQLSQHQWRRVHLIGHSAGAALIDGIAKSLKRMPAPPVIHETFLDPYTGKLLEGRASYGETADWADNYFVVDFLTDFAAVVIGQSTRSTSGPLRRAYNVDVGGTLAKATDILVFSSSGIADTTPAVLPTSPSPSHSSPRDFYLSTIKDSALSCAAGFGFGFSQEANGWDGWGEAGSRGTPNSFMRLSLGNSEGAADED